jgi:Fur family peroxide stress response transcriptional regulator
MLYIGLFKIDYYLINVMSNIQDLDSSIIKAFRGKGYKATPQRLAISRFALCCRDHPTAKIIYSQIKKAHPTVSLATVYATLQILKEVGLLQEMNLPQSKARFDPDMQPHVHLVCLQCDSIIDWINPLVSKVIAEIAADAKFSVTGQVLDITGLCSRCKGKTNLEKK